MSNRLTIERLAEDGLKVGSLRAELAEQLVELLEKQAEKLGLEPSYYEVLDRAGYSYRNGWREGILSLRDDLRALVLGETRPMGFATLEECQEHWEKGLTAICARRPTLPPSDGIVWIALIDEKEKTIWHCHRYVRLGDRWDCSVDHQQCDAQTAVAWAMRAG